MKAIRAALDPSDAQNHIRIVCFMTDGYVGNDMEIISEVQKHPNARVFAFGIGSSVNRFLLDKMAEQGRGEVEYVTLRDDGSAAAKRFHERVRNPLLTDITVDWSGLPVADVYPKRIPDLFSAKPVILSGRYTGSGRGVIRLRGKVSGRKFSRAIPVDLSEGGPRHDVLATLWARRRIDDLMSQDYNGIQSGNARPDIREAITNLGLEFRLMTQFTSFVAVEEMMVTDRGEPRRIEVPVDMPEGVSHEGVFGDDEKRVDFTARVKEKGRQPVTAGRAGAAGPSAGIGSGTAGGVGGGVGPGNGHGVGPGSRYDSGGRAAPHANGAKPTSIPASTGPSLAKSLDLSAKIERLSPEEPKSERLSPEELQRREILSKLHPSVAAVVERLLKKVAEPGPQEEHFVLNGKAAVQVWLDDTSKETIALLKKLGFEVLLKQKTTKIIIGWLPIEKLDALANMKPVRYVAPMTTSN